jgi:hypothetical protein
MTVLADGGTKIRLLAHQIFSVVNNLTLLSKLLDLWGGKALYKYLYLFTSNFYARRQACHNLHDLSPALRAVPPHLIL